MYAIKKSLYLSVSVIILCGGVNNVLAYDVSLENHTPHISLSDSAPSYQIARMQFLPDIYDDLGMSGRSFKSGYYTPDNDCAGYDLTECPKKWNCSDCTNSKLQKKYKKISCKDPYIDNNGDCKCPDTVTIGTNETCTKECDGKCITKGCVPLKSTEQNCTRGKKECSDGCGGKRQCCNLCTNTYTSLLPQNAHYIYQSCIDDRGINDIISGWICDTGYHKKGTISTCEKDCEITNCAAYPLTSCPEHGTCSNCTKTAQNCSTDGERYKLDSCEKGYELNSSATACVIIPNNSTQCPENLTAKGKCEQGYKEVICFDLDGNKDNGNECCRCEPDENAAPTTCPSGSALNGKCPSDRVQGNKSSTLANGSICYYCLDCSSYTLTSCPANTICSSCGGKYKVDKCQNGYKPCSEYISGASGCCPNNCPITYNATAKQICEECKEFETCPQTSQQQRGRCIACYDGFTLQNGRCVATNGCPAGHFSSGCRDDQVCSVCEGKYRPQGYKNSEAGKCISPTPPSPTEGDDTSNTTSETCYIKAKAVMKYFQQNIQVYLEIGDTEDDYSDSCLDYHNFNVSVSFKLGSEEVKASKSFTEVYNINGNFIYNNGRDYCEVASDGGDYGTSAFKSCMEKVKNSLTIKIEGENIKATITNNELIIG